MRRRAMKAPMAPMARIAACSNKGARDVNQDSCCVLVAQTSYGESALAVVCDGVGGLSQGELASTTVVRELCEWFSREFPQLLKPAADGFDVCAVKDSWRALLCDLNDCMRSYGVLNEALLGTTFTGVLACGEAYVIGHVGDCRAYVLSNDALSRLTEDQTLLALAQKEMHEHGMSAMSFPVNENAILQSVGTERMLRPAFYDGMLQRDNLVIVCSDGAYKRVGDAGLRDLLAPALDGGEQVLEKACEHVVAEAMRAGEQDNATVACFSVPASWHGRGGEAA